MSTRKLLKPCYWARRLGTEKFRTPSVASYVSAPLSPRWAAVVQLGTVVEVQSLRKAPQSDKVVYWVAVVVDVQGYFVKLRFLGCEDDASDDFWMNITTLSSVVGGIDYMVHPVGWATDNGRDLHPPERIKDLQQDWRSFLAEKLHGCVTIPRFFQEVFLKAATSKFVPGMKLEAVDPDETSCLKVAYIESVIGRRLEVVYKESEKIEAGNPQKFWFHDTSPMIRPVGWAKLHGQAIRSTQYHYDTCLQKILSSSHSDDEAPIECFLPPIMLESHKKSLDEHLKVAMKLEFFAPQYPDVMSVGTIRKVMPNFYLMIEADDGTSDAESNGVCLHATSNLLYPAGYAQKAGIRLRTPAGYEKRDFRWEEYLEETESLAVPADLLPKHPAKHEFEVDQYVEATDLLAPENVCVARIERVVDRLLLIHFEGFPCDYDQWVDCESPDIFPVGWCHSVGYKLSEPGAVA